MVEKFSPEVYRRYNLDLAGLTDAEPLSHFLAHPDERRIFGNVVSTVEQLSMRWLRGAGLEIGAGASPTPLFGSATTIKSDCDASLAYGGEAIDFQFSIDDPTFGDSRASAFYFVVTSHVLEHADSFLRGIKNLLKVTRSGGLIYIVAPDIELFFDHNWLPYFDFKNHIDEYFNPAINMAHHDGLYIAACGAGLENYNPLVSLVDDYRSALGSGEIPLKMRFLNHRHNYNFHDWSDIMWNTKEFFNNEFSFVDIRYGHERCDCHFMLKRL
jgi:hypothetical protein